MKELRDIEYFIFDYEVEIEGTITHMTEMTDKDLIPIKFEIPSLLLEGRLEEKEQAKDLSNLLDLFVSNMIPINPNLLDVVDVDSNEMIKNVYFEFVIYQWPLYGSNTRLSKPELSIETR